MQGERKKIFYLKRKVIFPNSNLSVVIRNTPASGEITKGDLIIAFPLRTIFDLVFYRNRIATLAEVHGIEPREKSLVLSLKGLKRVRLKKLISYRLALHEDIEWGGEVQIDGLGESIRKKCQELIFLINVNESDVLINLMNFISSMDQLTDFISNYFIIDFRRRYRVYQETDIAKRGHLVLAFLHDLIDKIAEKRKSEQ